MNPMYCDAGSKNSKFYTGMYELISAFFPAGNFVVF